MDFSTIHKKWREANFFLRQMGERESAAFGDHEEFEFFLSAFLNACKTVDNRFFHLDEAKYRAFKPQWASHLAPDDIVLFEYLIKDRNVEVHELGSRVQDRETYIPIRGRYRDKSGTAYAWGPPGSPPAQIIKPEYFFTIDGSDLNATVACRRHLDLIGKLIRDFTATYP